MDSKNTPRKKKVAPTPAATSTELGIDRLVSAILTVSDQSRLDELYLNLETQLAAATAAGRSHAFCRSFIAELENRAGAKKDKVLRRLLAETVQRGLKVAMPIAGTIAYENGGKPTRINLPIEINTNKALCSLYNIWDEFQLYFHKPAIAEQCQADCLENKIWGTESLAKLLKAFLTLPGFKTMALGTLADKLVAVNVKQPTALKPLKKLFAARGLELTRKNSAEDVESGIGNPDWTKRHAMLTKLEQNFDAQHEAIAGGLHQLYTNGKLANIIIDCIEGSFPRLLKLATAHISGRETINLARDVSWGGTLVVRNHKQLELLLALAERKIWSSDTSFERHGGEGVVFNKYLDKGNKELITTIIQRYGAIFEQYPKIPLANLLARLDGIGCDLAALTIKLRHGNAKTAAVCKPALEVVAISSGAHVVVNTTDGLTHTVTKLAIEELDSAIKRLEFELAATLAVKEKLVANQC